MVSKTRQMYKDLAHKRGATWFLDQMADLPDNLTGCTGSVAHLALSPLKSGRLFMPESVGITHNGICIPETFIEDRMFMIVREQQGKTTQGPYEFIRLSQRECPSLVHMVPTYHGGVLQYSVFGRTDPRPLFVYQSLFLPVDSDAIVRVRMSGQTPEITEGVLESGCITDWVREFITEHDQTIDVSNVHVLRPHIYFKRPVDAMHACNLNVQTNYSDGGQVTVGSVSTLSAMNEARTAADASARIIQSEAFRMNLMLLGLPPIAEYFIDQIYFKASRVICSFGGMCIRCSVTQVNPLTGEKQDSAPLDWLSKNLPPRADKPTSTTFGVNCAFDPSATGKRINFGNTFTILSEKE